MTTTLPYIPQFYYNRFPDVLPTKENILLFMEQLLAADCYDQKEEMSLFKDTPFGNLSVTTCTSAAMLLAYKFGGKVFGYHIPFENKQENLVGYWSQGHDFAIIGNYLVDWWLKHVDEGGSGIYDLTVSDDIEYVNLRYLPKADWKEVPIWEERVFAIPRPIKRIT